MGNSGNIRTNRAEGIDARKSGRVNPSAISISTTFQPLKQPPAPLDLAGMAQKAKGSGFADADAEGARFLMGRISFQHICGYLDLIKTSGEDVPRTIYEANELMTLDRRFQLSIFEAIGLFELQFRSTYAREMSLRYGAFAHRNPKLFKKQAHFEKFLKDYAVPYKRIKSGPDCRQKRHIAEYGDMPIWEAVEEISLGALSKLHKNTRSAAVRDAVAASFACDRDTFESWTGCLTVIRNSIAHFGMLLGKNLAIQPKKMPEVPADNTQPFFVTLMLMRMLRTNTYFESMPDLLFSARIFTQMHGLFDGRERERRVLGIPDDWRELLSNPDVSGLSLQVARPCEPMREVPQATIKPKFD